MQNQAAPAIWECNIQSSQSHGLCGRGGSQRFLTEKSCKGPQPHGASVMGRTSGSSIFGSCLQEQLHRKQASREHLTPIHVPLRVGRSPAGFSLSSSPLPSLLHVITPGPVSLPQDLWGREMMGALSSGCQDPVPGDGLQGCCSLGLLQKEKRTNKSQLCTHWYSHPPFSPQGLERRWGYMSGGNMSSASSSYF